MVHRLNQDNPDEQVVRLCDDQFQQLVELLTPGAQCATSYLAANATKPAEPQSAPVQEPASESDGTTTEG